MGTKERFMRSGWIINFYKFAVRQTKQNVLAR